MLQPIILPLVRHILTTVGGSLTGTGVVTENDVQTGVGAIMTLIGIGMSIWNALRNR